MFPTVLPVVVTFGVMGFASINLDIGTAMVAAILVGIGVDDTIHLLAEFYRRRMAGHTAAAAIQGSVLHVGQAVLTTSAALSLGFLVLTLSSWQSVASFGLLSGIAILGALVADLWILPALVLTFGSRGGPVAREQQPGPEEPPRRAEQVALTALVVGLLLGLLALAARGVPGSEARILPCRVTMTGVVPVIASTSGLCDLEPFDRIVALEGPGGQVPAMDRQAFLEAVRDHPGPVRLEIERRNRTLEVQVPVVVQTERDRLQNFLGALVLTLLLMGLVLSVYRSSKARAAPALVILFAAMCGEVISVICASHGEALEWVSTPIAPFLAAALMHVALTFPRERALVLAAPRVIYLPYLLGALLAAIELRALGFDPSFWALAERVMLLFAVTGAVLLGVNAVRAVQASSSPLERARARLSLSSFLGVPIILAPIAWAWGSGIPGGQLSFVLVGMGIFAVPLAYSITRYDLFDLPLQGRRVLEAVLHVALVGCVTAAAVAALAEAFPSHGPFVWALGGVAGALVAGAVRSHWLARIGSASSRMRAGLVEAYQQDAPLEITEDASARLVGRTLQTGLRGSGVAVFCACESGWRLSYAGRECPSLGGELARAAQEVLGQDTCIDLARGDVPASPVVELVSGSGFELVLAIEFDGARFGVILVAPPADRLAFGAEEIAFARSVANHAGVAMHAAAAGSRRLAAERQRALDRHATEVAHEVGSPLRVLERRARRLAERADDPRLVRAEARKLETVARTLLESIYAMASEPRATRQASRGSLHDAVVAAAASLDAPGASAQVLLSLPPGLPEVRDPMLVTRALVNLLDNGLEASSPGEPVWLSASRDEHGCVIEVRDRGSGMTSETLKRAFDPHFSTKEGENTGLGLCITRDIVRSLGGDLRLESAPGMGTRAVVRLPVPAADERLG
jgi:signal transduction histidine kinase